jgi:phage antirepressor YoqD-like protein
MLIIIKTNNYETKRIQHARGSKILSIKNVGSNNLFLFLRTNDILEYNNSPKEKYLQLGYFTIGSGTKNAVYNPRFSKTIVTELGLKWLIEKQKDKIVKWSLDPDL